MKKLRYLKTIAGGTKSLGTFTFEGALSSTHRFKTTYSGGIACYLHVTTDATDGRYGLYSLITATHATGTVWGVYGDVSWSGGGYVGLTGVQGRVTINDNYTGGTNYVYGTTGELVFNTDTVVNSASSVFAALNGVITSNGTPTFTTGHITCLYLNNLCDDENLSDTAGINCFAYMANNAGGKTMDDAIYLYGAYVTNFMNFNGCTIGGMVDTSHAVQENSTGRIKIIVDGDTRYLYYWD